MSEAVQQDTEQRVAPRVSHQVREEIETAQNAEDEVPPPSERYLVGRKFGPRVVLAKKFDDGMCWPYYHNLETEETVWDRPDEVPPIEAREIATMQTLPSWSSSSSAHP